MTHEIAVNASAAPQGGDGTAWDELLEGVRSIYEQVLGHGVPDSEIGLRALGGDSIALIHILSSLMDRYGVMPEIGDLTAEHSVAGMAGQLLSTLRSTGEASTAAETAMQAQGSECLVPLMPNRLSYFVRRRRGLLQWTMATPVLKLSEVANAPALREAFANLLRRHDSLRLSVVEDGRGALTQRVLDEQDAADAVISLTVSSAIDERHEEMEGALRNVEQAMQYGGALVRLVLFNDEAARVVAFAIVMHHLCVDYLAFCRAIEEFLAEYDALRRGLPSPTPPPRSSYAAFVEAFMQHQRDVVEQSSAYWSSLAWSKWQPLLPSIEASHPLNVEERTRECSASAPMIPAGVYAPPAADSHSLAARVIVATAVAYREWRGASALLIDVLFHGREQFSPSMDVGSLVGWMSDVRPILLDTGLDEAAMLQETERQLSWLGARGGSHGYIRHVDQDPARDGLRRMPQPEISLNLLAPSLPVKRYLGVCEPLWPRATMSPTPPHAQRAYLLSGGCKVADGELHLSWDFSGDLIDESEVASFARACAERFTVLNQLTSRDGGRV